MEQCGPDLVPFSVLCQVYGVIALAVSLSALSEGKTGSKSLPSLLPKVEFEQWCG